MSALNNKNQLRLEICAGETDCQKKLPNWQRPFYQTR